MSIPNILTIIRFLSVPAMLYFLIEGNLKLGLIIYVFASITDVVDGFVARKFNMITDLGKILDPIADKLLQFSALIGLCYCQIIPAWILVIFAVKEILLGIGCVKLIVKDNVIIQAKWFGKLSTCIFFLAIIISMLSRYYKIFRPYSLILMIVALAIAFFALIMYLQSYLQVVRNKKVGD